MGYAKTGLVEGYKATCASFLGIGQVDKDGNRGIMLSQLIPEGADTFTVADDNYIDLQLLGPNGVGIANYTYHQGDTNRSYKKGDGWYVGSTLITAGDENDVFLPSGIGLWMSGKTNYKFTSSGEVAMDTQQYELVDGYRLVANPYPTDIKLSQLVPAGAETFTVADDNYIDLQVLGPSGVGIANYTYHKGDTNRSYKKGDGWYVGSTLITPGDENDATIPAGSSLWMSGRNNYTISVVTPFEVAE